MMLSTKSIPVVPIRIKSTSEVGKEEGKGCSDNTLSFQSEHYQQLLNRAQQLQVQAQ